MLGNMHIWDEFNAQLNQARKLLSSIQFVQSTGDCQSCMHFARKRSEGMSFNQGPVNLSIKSVDTSGTFINFLCACYFRYFYRCVEETSTTITNPSLDEVRVEISAFRFINGGDYVGYSNL